MENHVLVIGSTCVDVIIRVDHLPHTEENLHPDGQQFAIGGCAYNAANILAVSYTHLDVYKRQWIFLHFVYSPPHFSPRADRCVPKCSKIAVRFCIRLTSLYTSMYVFVNKNPKYYYIPHIFVPVS